MNKDFTNSDLQRQNVLNNSHAVQEIESNLNLGGIKFKGETVFTKNDVAKILGVDERTIDRYIESNIMELSKNGYELLKGKKLSNFKVLAYANDICVVSINPRTSQLGLFTFKSLLNLSMLLVESENARLIRSRILDIVISSITKKAGDIKYINQRDEDYLYSDFQAKNYHKEFISSIQNFTSASKSVHYAIFTNLVYKAIFKENVQEYKKILDLNFKDNPRDTFYAEVLDLIASFEAGFAEKLEMESDNIKRQLSFEEAKDLFYIFEKQAMFKPLINKARTIMASRDYSLRDAIHHKLTSYIQEIPEMDYERFLGEKSKDLAERIEENLEIYKRLKDR